MSHKHHCSIFPGLLSAKVAGQRLQPWLLPLYESCDWQNAAHYKMLLIIICWLQQGTECYSKFVLVEWRESFTED